MEFRQVSSAPGSPEQRAGMRAAIRTQCFGIVAEGMIVNGILLLYLTALGVDAASTMVYLAIYPMAGAALLLPFAWLADRIGKKIVGQGGLILGTLGWTLIGLAGFFGPTAPWLIGIGIFLAALCFSMLGASWFSLLSPVIPKEIRGRFFARLRTWFSVISIILSLTYAAVLEGNNAVIVYQIIFLIAAVAYVARYFSYRQIPELEPPAAGGHIPFLTSIQATLHNGPLAKFCGYALLLTLFTAGAGSLIAMTEKRVIEYSDGRIIVLANLAIGGSICGMYFGGKIIDRFGPRSVFAGCHIALGLGLFAFLLRVLFDTSTTMLIYLGVLHFILGSARGAIGIAMTTELMGLLPEKNKSVAAATFSIFQTVGVALSGFLPAWLLKSGRLSESWSAAGYTFSDFDSILLGYSAMTLLLISSLALVPSMQRKAEPTSLGLNRL